jgi:predicted membrane chloride channel (bestrophin family)
MRLMPLLLTRSLPVQILVVVVLPIAFGLLTGWMLGLSAGAYLVFSVLGILGGIGAGFDHDSTDQGVVRGLCGGLLFGTSILVMHSLTGQTAKASLPHPHAVLVVITVILGALCGALGAHLRKRAEAREATAS